MAQSSASKSRTGPREAQLPPFTVGEAAVQGSAAHSANHLDNKRRQRGVVGEVACVMGTTAPDLAYRSHANR